MLALESALAVTDSVYPDIAPHRYITYLKPFPDLVALGLALLARDPMPT